MGLKIEKRVTGSPLKAWKVFTPEQTLASRKTDALHGSMGRGKHATKRYRKRRAFPKKPVKSRQG